MRAWGVRLREEGHWEEKDQDLKTLPVVCKKKMKGER